jgi:hypothetical protein
MPKGVPPPCGNSALSRIIGNSPAKTPFKHSPMSGFHIMGESSYKSSVGRQDFGSWLQPDSNQATPNTQLEKSALAYLKGNDHNHEFNDHNHPLGH